MAEHAQSYHMLHSNAGQNEWAVPDLERPAHPKAENFFKSAYVGRSKLKSAGSAARSASQYNIKCYKPHRANFVRTGRGRFNEELEGNQWEVKSNASRQSGASVASRSFRRVPREEAQRPAEEPVSAKKRTLEEAKQRDLELHEPRAAVENPEEEGDEFERAPPEEGEAAGGDSKSVRSAKSYVNSLREEIEKEREVRKDLERQVEELKRLSSEISSHLGLATPKGLA